MSAHADDPVAQGDSLRAMIDLLENRQRDLELDFTSQIAELRQRLGALQGVAPSESGATASTGRVEAGAGGVAVGGDVHGDIYVSTPSAAPPHAELRTSYLSWLFEQVRAVPLAGVDPASIRQQTRQELELAAVYTALMTQRTEAAGTRETYPERELSHLSALAVLNAESRLALLGDPGSGKSTFVNFVALCMAGELLRRGDANLTVLTTPVPDDNWSPSRSGEPPASQPWDHGPLLPIRVVLREFVARGLAPSGPRPQVGADTLWQFIVGELPETLRDFTATLRADLLNTGGLLLLDGLDEVPEADERRTQVKAAVEQFAAMFPRVRMLVTSRTYAYQRQDWKLRQFAEAVLAPFGTAQARRFVARWYAYVGPARGLSAEAAEGGAFLLNDAIARNPRLSELASRPLLLTLMALLHVRRGGTLPEQREALYAATVELLLEQWESQKLRRLADGSFEVVEPSLAEWLRVEQQIGRQTMRQRLNRLAFEVHRSQAGFSGTADIAEKPLMDVLMEETVQDDPDRRPARLLEYLRDRAGLLEPRGVGIYAFPHGTVQEYLAACHLTDVRFPEKLADLLRADPNRWREVVLLAGAKAARGTVPAVWDLAEALCFREAPQTQTQDVSGYWGALLAAQVLIETNSLDRISERHLPKVERIRQWLVCTLKHGALSPVDRAQSGNALAIIGDPRFRADAWFLPDEPLLGFVEIPPGHFLMGSDKAHDRDAFDEELPQHRLSLPRYYLARYPVSVAQFRAFVEDSGTRPEEPDSLQGVANHPVVNVSWYEALNYCDWLTTRLREWSGTPEPLAMLLRQERWRVTLPSEAEWEKAARGSDGRIYPWGKEPDPNRANYDETGINATSAVGCFPAGASPWGCLDMAGNVEEWTRSLWGKSLGKPDYRYPYKPHDGREHLEAAQDVIRVRRGGAFYYDHRSVRCASRHRLDPLNRYRYLGFRVVVRPCS